MRTHLRPSRPNSVLRRTPMAAALAFALAPLAVPAATFTVSNGNSFGTGSLSDAITQVNAHASCATAAEAHTIEFSGGPFTIQPSSPLPTITCPRVTINASQATGHVIDGAFAYGGSCALTSNTAQSTVVHRLTIRNFAYGTGLCGTWHAHNNTLTNLQNGMDLTGSVVAIGNTVSNIQQEGIFTDGSGAQVTGNTVSGAGFVGIHVAFGGPVSNNTVFNSNDGMYLLGSEIVASGNTARNNTGVGISASGAAIVTGNFVYANSVGIELDDAFVDGNTIGAIAGGAPNTIGIEDFSSGGGVIHNNLISGNTQAGIKLWGFGTTITNNRIGTNAAGTGAFPNGVGIQVESFAYGSTISSNTISGNNGAGIFFDSPLSDGVLGNRIGVSADGLFAIGNGSGIDVACGGSNLHVSGNTISGNAGHGITLAGYSGNFTDDIIGNRIGLQETGAGPVPNGGNGITFDLMGPGCFADATPKASGKRATALSDRMARKRVAQATRIALQPKAHVPNAVNNTAIVNNFISRNNGHGVQIFDGHGNTIIGNRIWANTQKNIDLGNPAGPLPNDPLDADTGPNNKQNSPTITQLRHLQSGETALDFELISESHPTGCTATTPFGYTYRIDIFENAAAGPPAGQAPIANTFLPGAPCGGAVSGSFTITSLRDFLSLTARNETSFDSSEFSAIVQAVPLPAVTVSPPNVNFGNVPANNTASQNITVSSVGATPYRISVITPDTCGRAAGTPFCTAPFSCTTTCVANQDYTTGQSCTISATFAPTAQGTFTNTFSICDNASGSTRAVTLSGTGTPPAVVTLAPLSFDFGSVRVGQKSTFKSFSIVNNNATAVTISSVTVAGDFVLESHNCPSLLPAGQGCQALVSFLPVMSGITNGNLTIAGGPAAGSNAVASLSGNGVQVAEIVLPSNVDFGVYTLGTPAVTRTVTFTNTGNIAATFSSITTTPPFTLTDNCSPTLAAGASCSLVLTFGPANAGSYNGTLAVASNANGGSGNVPLTGTAQAAPVPQATLSTNHLDLGATPVGQTSAQKSITVTSSGTAPYIVTRYSADASCSPAAPCSSGEFLCSFGCNPGQHYAPGATCSISAKFAPQSLGVRSTTFYICDNTSVSPRAVTLTGEGTNPTVVNLAPSSFDFGTVRVNQVSDPRAFTLANGGDNAVTLGSPIVSGPFRVTSNNCPASLPPAGRCTILMVFAPTSGGAARGQLIIQGGQGATLANAVADLTGTGGTQPTLEVATLVDLGSVTVGSSAAVRTLTISNTGTAALSITGISITGPFVLTNECPASLAPGASCAVRVSFTPTDPGEFTGTLTVNTNAPGGPRTVEVVARAQPLPLPSIRVNPGNMGFGDRQIGSQSGTQRVTVTNVGGAAAAIDRIVLGPDFVIGANTCGPSLPPQQSCQVDVALRPVGFGPRQSQLQVFSNSDGSPHSVNLNGTGCRPFSIVGRGAGRNAACAP